MCAMMYNRTERRYFRKRKTCLKTNVQNMSKTYKIDLGLILNVKLTITAAIIIITSVSCR